MDIFNAPKRTKDDSIKKALNYPSQEVTEQKLQKDNENQSQKLNIFLRKLYMKFDFKVNRCKKNCINQANTYKDIAQCEEICQEGSKKFSSYVDSRLAEMQQLLGECVANASTLHNTMDEIYYCYEMYNLGFSTVKQYIVEESLFYE